MTKPPDTPKSVSEPPAVESEPTPAVPDAEYRVQRRLKKGAYRDEFLYLMPFWIEWHFFPLGPIAYAPVFETQEVAEEFIKVEQQEWPNFEYKIMSYLK